MTKNRVIFIVVVVILLFIYLYSLKQKKNNYPKVAIIDVGKSRFAAITLFPFFILINKSNTGDPKLDDFLFKADYIHEMIHWKQAQKEGLFQFYFNYILEFLKHGSYSKNPYEQEAYKKTGRINDGRYSPEIEPTNIAPELYDDNKNNVYYMENGNKILLANIDKDYVKVNVSNKPYLIR